MMVISENIRMLRKSIGITQEQLAEKLNISSQAVSKWETSQSVPDTMLLPTISKIFGVTIDTLFKENMENYDSLASKLATIYEDTNNKEDFQQADLAFKRLFAEGKYSATDLYLYACSNHRYAWSCFHTAEEYFNKAMEMAGDENDLTYNLALNRLIELKGDMKQIQQIIDALKTKYHKNPTSHFLREKLITAYRVANQIEEAEEIIDLAIAAGYEEWYLYQTKGDFLYSRNLLHEALVYFEKAWAIDSKTYCDTLYSFLCIYKDLGNKEKAIEICNQWLKWYDDRGAIIEKKAVERELEKLL